MRVLPSNPLFAAIALSTALALVSCSGDSPAAGEGTLIEVEANDAAMAAAERRAVETQNVFWDKFAARVAGDSDFAAKVPLTGTDGYQEYIWAEVIQRDGDVIVARLANDPVHLPNLQIGSEVRVGVDRLADWTYTRDGKAYGHFTTRVLAKQATPAQRAEMESMIAPTPLESGAS